MHITVHLYTPLQGSGQNIYVDPKDSDSTEFNIWVHTDERNIISMMAYFQPQTGSDEIVAIANQPPDYPFRIYPKPWKGVIGIVGQTLSQVIVSIISA